MWQKSVCAASCALRHVDGRRRGPFLLLFWRGRNGLLLLLLLPSWLHSSLHLPRLQPQLKCAGTSGIRTNTFLYKKENHINVKYLYVFFITMYCILGYNLWVPPFLHGDSPFPSLLLSSPPKKSLHFLRPFLPGWKSLLLLLLLLLV